MKKNIIITFLCVIATTSQASEWVRCKSDTSWGLCTSEAVTTDCLCTLHQRNPLASCL